MDVEDILRRLEALESRPTKDSLPRPVIYSVAANLTLNQSEMGVWHMIEATDPFDLTLPAPFEGMWVGVWNWGDSLITVKDDGAATIGTIAPAQGSHILCPYAAGVADWPAAIMVMSSSGNLYLQGDLVIRNSAKGIVHTDTTDGHFIRTVATADALVSTDLGATEPS